MHEKNIKPLACNYFFKVLSKILNFKSQGTKRESDIILCEGEVGLVCESKICNKEWRRGVLFLKLYFCEDWQKIEKLENIV
jgi:hypothetical protein